MSSNVATCVMSGEEVRSVLEKLEGQDVAGGEEGAGPWAFRITSASWTCPLEIRVVLVDPNPAGNRCCQAKELPCKCPNPQ